MDRVFTRLVQALPADPGDELVSAAWTALGNVLRKELQRRSLWEAPPSYLGIFGWERWYFLQRRGPGGDAVARQTLDRGPLDELVAECFSYNFVERHRSLVAQLRTKPNIEGVVRLNVRHFLYERQRKYDPIGFRVFEVTREGVERALSRGALFQEGNQGGPAKGKSPRSSKRRVSNSTILALSRREAPLASREELEVVARRWNDSLLPHLLLAAGRNRQKVVQHLAEKIGELPQDGVLRFRFRDLVDPIKADTRARWAEDLSRRDGKSPDNVSLPDLSLEQRESFEWLALEVRASIRRLPMDDRKRAYLERLWSFFAPGSGGDEGQLSHRALARRLAIPRERMADLMTTLGEVLTNVRATHDLQHPQEGR